MDPLLGILVLVFICISTGCLVYLHFLPTGLNPLRNAVSEYGAGHYRFWYQAMCVSQAAAAFLTAAVLATNVKPAPVETDAALIVLGIARLVIAKAPVVKAHGKRVTTTGTHIVMAFLIFSSAVVASLSFNKYIAGNSDWANIIKTLHIFSWAIALFAAATFMAVVVGRWDRCLGLVERLLYLSIIGWFVTIAIHLI